MNILFVLPEYYPHSGGGISTYYLHYIQALRNHCSSIHIIVGSGYTQDEKTYEVDGIQIEYLKPSIFDSYLKKFTKFALFPEYQRNLAAAWAMWDQVGRGNKYDIIECTDFGLGYVPWVVNHNKPIITRLHGSFGQIELQEPELKQNFSGDLNRQTELYLLSQSDILITHSKSNQQYWSNILNKDIQIIYPVYNPPLIEVTPSSEQSNFIIVCGRIQQWKGPDILCKAVQELDDLDTEIRWYGNNTAFSDTISKSDILQKEYPNIWESKIIWHGALPNDKILTLQRKSKFAIIPSTWDMFNFTCLEYMSAGIPVICSDGAGVSELIENGINGFKYQKYDYSALASNITFLNKISARERERIIRAGVLTVTSLLSPEKIIPQNITLYKECIKSFQLTLPNNYTRAIYEPSDNKFEVEDFLKFQPLAPLLRYMLKRIKKRIFK